MRPRLPAAQPPGPARSGPGRSPGRSPPCEHRRVQELLRLRPPVLTTLAFSSSPLCTLSLCSAWNSLGPPDARPWPHGAAPGPPGPRVFTAPAPSRGDPRGCPFFPKHSVWSPPPPRVLVCVRAASAGSCCRPQAARHLCVLRSQRRRQTQAALAGWRAAACAGSMRGGGGVSGGSRASGPAGGGAGDSSAHRDGLADRALGGLVCPPWPRGHRGFFCRPEPRGAIDSRREMSLSH